MPLTTRSCSQMGKGEQKRQLLAAAWYERVNFVSQTSKCWAKEEKNSQENVCGETCGDVVVHDGKGVVFFFQ